jgi:hypothetical protein
MTPEPTTQPWTQQPDESAGAFATFREYLDLGPDLTLAEFAEKTCKPLGSVRNLSSRHHWFERAAAWRQHLARIACAAAEETTRQTAILRANRAAVVQQLEWESAQKLAQVGRQLLNHYLNDPESQSSISEVTQLFSVFSRLARLATAQPTEHHDHEHKLTTTDGIPPKLAAALDTAYGPKESEASPPAETILQLPAASETRT